MSAIDRAALEEAVAKLGQCPPWGVPKEIWEPLFAAARAHLDTLPKTETVLRWHVEWCEILPDSGKSILWVEALHHNEYSAKAAAEALKLGKQNVCIRVTGPHEHEVPA